MRLGYSFCPNDTFIFHALTHGRIEGLEVDEVLADVETLNQWAAAGQLELTKVSTHALFHVLDQYQALRSGGALGRGVGPLLVSKPGAVLNCVATPGLWTTAHLLLQLAQASATVCMRYVCMRYDMIIPAIINGQVDGGVIIHESRFAYQNYGLEARLDLGQWWEQSSGLPLPLGLILARRDFKEEQISKLNLAVRQSLEMAWSNPADSVDYISQHAHELSPEIIRRHIATYVNEFSRDLGNEGEAAVTELYRCAVAAGLVSPSNLPLFCQ